MKKTGKFTTLTLSAALSLCVSSFALGDSLQANISVDSNYLNNYNDVDVTVTVVNKSAEPQKILSWMLSEGRLDNDMFVVTRDGAEVEYEGRLIRRAAPTDKDYLVLQPNESYSSVVELSSAYDISASGSYDIRLQMDKVVDFSAPMASSALTDSNKGSLSSNTVSFWMDGSQYKAPAESETEMFSSDYAGFTVEACSNSQRNSISSAENSATSMASNSSSYLNGGSTGPRYTTWFGSYNSSRYSTVRSNFSSILDALRNKPIVYNCSCNENYYAYVYPNRPYKIYLCNTFWQVPTSGANSKADTIIHELSHFNVVAGTDDYGYGESYSKNLARTSPGQAIRNADNYSYFAANSPYQN